MAEHLNTDDHNELDGTKCQALKGAGHEVHVLSLGYPASALLSGNDEKVAQVDAIRHLAIDGLKACASPGKYMEADWADTVKAAFKSFPDGVTEGRELSLVK